VKRQVVVLNQIDNVGTALEDMKSGDTFELQSGEKVATIRVNHDIPFGHKFSLSEIGPGSPVIKYGEIIGAATTVIRPGDYVHVHNVVSNRGRGDLQEGSK